MSIPRFRLYPEEDEITPEQTDRRSSALPLGDAFERPQQGLAHCAGPAPVAGHPLVPLGPDAAPLHQLAAGSELSRVELRQAQPLGNERLSERGPVRMIWRVSGSKVPTAIEPKAAGS